MWELILQGYKHPSDKKGTLRQYEKVWADFVGFCGKDTKKLRRAAKKRREPKRKTLQPPLPADQDRVKKANKGVSKNFLHAQ